MENRLWFSVSCTKIYFGFSGILLSICNNCKLTITIDNQYRINITLWKNATVSKVVYFGTAHENFWFIQKFYYIFPDPLYLCTENSSPENTFFFLSSQPLPKDMNVFIRYYIDWIIQCTTCTEFYTMYCTSILFLVGMCLYITEMVNDLKTTLNDLNGDARTITKGIIGEIKFHRFILE